MSNVDPVTFVRRCIVCTSSQKSSSLPKKRINFPDESNSSAFSQSDSNSDSAVDLNRNIFRHIIVWFEPTLSIRKDFQDAREKLKQMSFRSAMYTNSEKCIKDLPEICLGLQIVILLPSIWAQDLLSRIRSTYPERPIGAVFIYSSSPQQYDFLRSQYPSIRGIYQNIKEAVSAIEHHIDERCEVLLFHDQQAIRDLSYENTTAEFVWFTLFKRAVIHLPHDDAAKSDMLTLCRNFYVDNPAQLHFIEDFEKNYKSEDAPGWFSRSFFLYKLVNRALRTQNVEQLYAFRYFIRDLSEWVCKNFHKIMTDKEKFYLYRGAAVSPIDLRSLLPGKLVVPNGFFATSRVPEVAQWFMGSSRPDAILVMYKIECDMKSYFEDEINDLVCFADISGKSFIRDEDEVIFDLGATFEVENIEFITSEKNYYLVSLIPSCEGAYITNSYFEIVKDDIENLSPSIKFGALLCKTGKYKSAEYYFQRLCSQSSGENLNHIYYYLGWSQLKQGNHEQSATSLERAYDLTPPADNLLKTSILNNIGKILIEKNLIKESMDYYEKVLDLRIHYLGLKHHDVADSFTNVARLNELAGNHGLALNYHKKSLMVKSMIGNSNSTTAGKNTTERWISFEYDQCSDVSSENELSSKITSIDVSADVSDSLYEIGSMQWKLGETAAGLKTMRRSQSLDKFSRSSSLSSHHSSLKSTGNVSSRVSHDNRAIQYALRCLKEAKNNPSITEAEIADAMEDVGHAYKARRKFNKALKYYNSALERRQKEKNSRECSLKIAWTLNEIGDTYRALDDLEQALEKYQSCFKIRRIHLPRDHNDRQCLVHKIDQVIWQISAANSRSAKNNFVNRSTPNVYEPSQQNKADLPPSRSRSQQNLCSMMTSRQIVT